MLNTLSSVVAVVGDLTLAVAVEQVVLFLITVQCLLVVLVVQELQDNQHLLVDFLLQEIMQLLLVLVVLV